MQPLPVSNRIFNCVAKRVPEIQQRPLVGLSLILGNNLRFDFAGASNSTGQRHRVTCEQVLHIVFEPFEETYVHDRAVFDDFG